MLNYNNRILEKAFKNATPKLTYTELAAKAGYSEAWARAIVNGKCSNPTRRCLEAFARALKVPVNQVYV